MTVEEPGTALAVVAHPDDVEFNFGGTLAGWIDAGWRVVYVIATRGDKGSDDLSMTSERLAALSAEEQRAAAASLGAAGVEFLGYYDDAPDAAVAVSPPVSSDTSCPAAVSLSSIVAISDFSSSKRFPDTRPQDRTRPVRKRLVQTHLRGEILKRRAGTRGPGALRGR